MDDAASRAHPCWSRHHARMRRARRQQDRCSPWTAIPAEATGPYPMSAITPCPDLRSKGRRANLAS